MPSNSGVIKKRIAGALLIALGVPPTAAESGKLKPSGNFPSMTQLTTLLGATAKILSIHPG
jgi:hypothetical protein